jgi:leucyl-tRNA synthetase
MKATGHLDVKEPFKGLFTQGMVVHETYKGKDGWVEPAAIRLEDFEGRRRAILIDSGEEVAIGSIEKMSKSKKNVVDPDDIIASYGADTARWFMLSDSPPDRDVIWTEAGVEGAHRFVQRVWRLVSDTAGIVQDAPAGSADSGHALTKAVHKAVKAVGEDIEKLAFNKAVARLYELVNTMQEAMGAASKPDAGTLRASLEALILMIAPMMPHLAEECWAAIGGEGLAAAKPWPSYDPALVVDSEIVLPVQINGKKRGDLTIARDADQLTVEKAVLDLDFVQKALEGKAPRKVIVVPQRIVNVVA